MSNSIHQETEIQKSSENLSHDIYDARSIIIRIEELVADGNYRILDEKDYREEYVGMLRSIDHILKNYDTKNVLNSCTIVARSLRDSSNDTSFEQTSSNKKIGEIEL
jgi:hypothetical protein